jgi:hypothetical protein
MNVFSDWLILVIISDYYFVVVAKDGKRLI